jgi:hypothetical protein
MKLKILKFIYEAKALCINKNYLAGELMILYQPQRLHGIRIKMVVLISDTEKMLQESIIVVLTVPNCQLHEKQIYIIENLNNQRKHLDKYINHGHAGEKTTPLHCLDKHCNK